MDAAPGRLPFNPDTGRAELTDFWAVMTNKVQLVTFPHTVVAAYMTGGAFVAGVAFWLMIRGRTPEADRPMYRTGGARRRRGRRWSPGSGVAVTGDMQGKMMTEVQPMKMAAAEALYDTEQPAAFSLLTIGSLDGTEEKFAIKIPHLLSFLATGNSTARWRASTSCARSTRRRTARTRARSTTPPATTPRSSRSPTGPSG